MSAAYLLLEDGERFDGDWAGPADTGEGLGEVVFNTSMSGYQEAVTDPSYAGQIIVFTYPLIGNYGVTAAHMESDRIHARAVITSVEAALFELLGAAGSEEFKTVQRLIK